MKRKEKREKKFGRLIIRQFLFKVGKGNIIKTYI